MSVAGWAAVMFGALYGASGFRVTYRQRACGSKRKQSASVLDLSIINGADSKRCAWPWQVALAEYDNYTSCGGTIISEKYVLSAAHCEDHKYVIAGLHKRDKDKIDQEPDVQHRVIVHRTRHPLYDKSDVTSPYDVMVVEVNKPFIFNDCVGMACLPKESFANGVACWITGYGSVTPNHYNWKEKKDYNKKNADVLQEAQVHAFTEKECTIHFNYDRGELDKTQFCAGTLKKQGEWTENSWKDGWSKDACVGDSGGPLVCPDSDDKYTLYGVASFGYGCGDPHIPGIYTHVFLLKDWIDNLIT